MVTNQAASRKGIKAAAVEWIAVILAAELLVSFTGPARDTGLDSSTELAVTRLAAKLAAWFVSFESAVARLDGLASVKSWKLGIL
jgi:hypothetical protein